MSPCDEPWCRMLAASAGARTPARGGNPAVHHNGFLVPAPGRPICAPPAAQEARYTGPSGAVLAFLEWQIALPGGDFSDQPALRCNLRFLVPGPKTRFVETADPVQRVTTISTEPARLIAGFVSLPQRFRTRAYAVIRNSGFVQRHGSSSLFWRLFSHCGVRTKSANTLNLRRSSALARSYS